MIFDKSNANNMHENRFFLSFRQNKKERKKSHHEILFILANPSPKTKIEQNASTASIDETVKFCMEKGIHDGYARISIVNSFSCLGNDQKKLRELLKGNSKYLNQSSNDIWIEWAIKRADYIVAAWGEMGNLYNRNAQITDILIRKGKSGSINCLSTTKDGFPQHLSQQSRNRNQLTLTNSFKIYPYI